MTNPSDLICQRCAKWQRGECEGKDLKDAVKCDEYEDITLTNI